MTEITHIKGLDKLARALRELPKNVMAKQKLRKPVAIAARLIADEAARRAPVNTGVLQQSIIIKRETGTDQTRAVYDVAPRHGKAAKHSKLGGDVVNLDAYYWTFVEFGTSKMAAEPFLRPAFEANKWAALELIVNGLAAGVQQEAIAVSWGTPP